MTEVIVVTPNDKDPLIDTNLPNIGVVCSIFLAGTIDKGNSVNWQNEYIERLKKTFESADKLVYNSKINYVILYNPRRDDYPENNQNELEKQIAWELEHLEKADTIYMNILADSKSPITLMELGLYANSGKLKVVCPEDFYRYTNVKMICEKYKVPYKNKYMDKWINNESKSA